MKLVKKVRLAFREGKSDKVYEVDLVELPGNDAARYLVNFRYGRRGTALREGTKTARSVTLEEAEAVYNSVVVSKTNSGYWDESGPQPAPRPTAPRPTRAVDTGARQAARLAALLKALGGEKDSKRRARLIWNLGNSEAAAQAMAAVTANLGRGDWIEDYSIAWTLGRWRDDAGLNALEKLRRHENTNVRELAIEALLLTQTPSVAANEVQAERAGLPQSLRTALDTRNEISITDELRSLEAEHSSALNRALTVCYRIALFEPQVHRALLACLATCALAPGVFKGVRSVFKAAELRIDYDMYACLAHRFDTVPAFFKNNWDHAYIPGQGSMVVSKEMKRENSRLAYSHKTRNYLRRRSWRAMHQLGRADSAHYVALAAAALLRVTDANAQEPRTRETFRWDEETGRSRRAVKREYDEYAHLTLFNHILRGADPGYKLSPTGSAWYRRGKARADVRGESYAHLWDRAPAAALDLLKRSRCGVVHDAAIRMLAVQADFLNALSPGEVGLLLQSPYAQTAQFALPLAQALFSRGAGDDGLLLALLRSTLPQAREFGVQQLSAQPAWTSNTPLLIELLLTFAPPIPGIVDSALSGSPLPDAVQQEVVAGVITQLLARDLALDNATAEALAKLLAQRLPVAVASIPATLLDRLLSHHEAGKQLLGARLLVASSMKFTEIPGRLLQHIHGSPHDEVRAVAIALLGKQTPEDLLKQAENLAELLHRGSAVERRELLALFEKLARQDEARVLRVLSPLLFRAELQPGQGDELVDFFTRHQGGAANAFDKDTVWRLLQAQATAAQRVGAALLPGRQAREFSVRQWARLGQHPDLSVRRFAMAAYEAHEAEVRQHTRDALLLLDGTWDDAREFGFRFFRDHYRDADWSPEYIIGVCDNTLPDVQAFGRELLQRFFHQEQGPQYLAALSEHPSINVQLFVSGFLENHAAGQRDRILALRGYFVTVLSQVNKARVNKDRVLEFLLRESLRDSEVANMVAEIFTRLSLTVVRKDRSQLLTALIALQNAFPHLVLPIKAVPVTLRGAPAAAEVPGGV
jgi:hypothetical protein